MVDDDEAVDDVDCKPPSQLKATSVGLLELAVPGGVWGRGEVEGTRWR